MNEKIPPRTPDDFEEMLAAFDRVIHDKELQQQLIDTGLLVRIEPGAEAAQGAAPRHRDYAGNVLPSIRFKEGACRWCDSFGSHSADCPIRLEFEKEGAAPRSLEVEAWIAGYVAGREDGPGQPDDEVAERAVDAVCAIRMDAIASEGAAPQSEWVKCLTIGCDRIAGLAGGRCAEHYASEGAAPRGNAERAEGLDVERLAKAIYAADLVEPVTFSVKTVDSEAERIAAEYARLSRPSDEEEGNSACNRFRHDEHCAHLHES